MFFTEHTAIGMVLYQNKIGYPNLKLSTNVIMKAYTDNQSALIIMKSTSQRKGRRISSQKSPTAKCLKLPFYIKSTSQRKDRRMTSQLSPAINCFSITFY